MTHTPSNIWIAVTIMLVLAAGWYLIPRGRHDKINPPTTQTSPAENSSTKDAPQLIKERAGYIYDFLTAPGDFRYQDLQTKGYITQGLLDAQTKSPGHDLLTCSQQPADTYSYGDPTITADNATLVVTAGYPDSSFDITTTWVNQAGAWKINKSTCPPV